MLGKKKQVRGIELIDQTAKQFDLMIELLNRGAEECIAEQEGIKSTIEQLTQRNIQLDKSVARAGRITENLHRLIE